MQLLVVYFTHQSLVLSVRYRLITASRTLQPKGEMCTLQTGKLCYHAINISGRSMGEARGARPPFLFDQNEVRRAKKNILGHCPPFISASGWPPPPPPLIWRSGSATEYHLRPCACVYAELQEKSISSLSWSFVKEFTVSSYRKSYAQVCTG